MAMRATRYQLRGHTGRRVVGERTRGGVGAGWHQQRPDSARLRVPLPADRLLDRFRLDPGMQADPPRVRGQEAREELTGADKNLGAGIACPCRGRNQAAIS